VAEKKWPTGDPCKEKFIKELARLTDIHYKLRKRGIDPPNAQIPQSNVTIAMTEFDNLRELNAYAIDIARDYFARKRSAPRRDRQGNTETEPAAVLNGAGGFGVAPPQHRILLPKKRGSKTESL
jgi:hypothetical protein